MRIRTYLAPCLLAAILATLGAGCNQINVGFARFQLVNQTPYSIVEYRIARTEFGLGHAQNRLSEALQPGEVFDGNVHGPGLYWLQAVADVDGTLETRTEGPLHIYDNNAGWAWYMEDGEIRHGAGPRDLYARSELPIVVFDTMGLEIPDEPKIDVPMQVRDDPNAAWNNPRSTATVYDSFAGIERRGNSSQTFDKISYGVETRDEEGDDNELELLGYPEEEDWVFYGPWMDRSLVRNVIGYGLWEDLGYYAPRTQFVEVYINDFNAVNIETAYNGVYVFTEQIKRDKNRVDIKKLDEDDTELPKITGGYILELKDEGQVDEGDLLIPSAGGFFLAVNEPDPEDINDEQQDYIFNHMAAFENALFGEDFADPDLGYAAYINVDSFVDYILLQEFFKNRDGMRSSAFMHKDREDKITMGPIWDLNLIFGYFSLNGFNDPEGFLLTQPKNDIAHSPWTDRLFQDPAFANRFADRWEELRQGLLQKETLFARIDGAVSSLGTAHVRNFVRWESLGKTLIPDLRFLMYLGPHPNSWQGELENLKQWIEDRGTWLDEHIGTLRS